MTLEEINIYRAISSLAFALAKADGNIQDVEKEAFIEILQEEFGKDSWSAVSRFDLLEDLNPSVENTYNEAMGVLRMYKKTFTPIVKEKAVRILLKVAESFRGITEMESIFIERFKREALAC